MTDDFADRVAGVAALAEPARRELYLYVVGQEEPVSRDQAAAGVGVPRHTAKFHLDKLVEEGLLTTEFRRLTGRQGPGAGRPAKLYRRAAGEVAVSLPERRYDLAGRLMATAIDDAAATGSSVSDALARAAAGFGAALAEQGRSQDAADTADTVPSSCDALCAVLRDHGYEPHLDEELLTLRNCPFHALAQEHTELVCGMNLALITAAAEHLDPGLEARLEPAEGRCCVVVATP
jgi:predicted ArsR family transcriptional regulator